MNHRCGTRRPLSMIVLVRRRAWAGWIVAELRNLSVSGAYLALHSGRLPPRAQIRLEAPAPGPGWPRLLHCSAMVARVEPGGVGVVFDELAPPGLAPLFERLRHDAAQDPPAAMFLAAPAGSAVVEGE